MDYFFLKYLDENFAIAKDKVIAALKENGFGVLTEIDVREKFREKLDINFKPYVILGACNPAMAHKAICAEENIGIMLPCNVILYEKEGKTAVAGIKPTVAMNMIDNKDLQEIAKQVENNLTNVFMSLS